MGDGTTHVLCLTRPTASVAVSLQVRDEAEALRTQAAGAELAQKDLQSRTEEVAAKNQVCCR